MLKMTGSFLISASLALCSIVAISSSGQPKLAACPKMCACENSFCRRRRGTLRCTGVAVNCYAKNLTIVPDDVPSNVTGFLLTNNKFSEIDFDSMEPYTMLRDLLIDNNNVSRFSITQPVRKLKRLSLKNNQLPSLPRKNLTLLRNLEELRLQDNRIQDITGIRFPKKLEVLNLNNNLLASLTSGCFRNSKMLRVLKINNNQISRMTSAAFRHLKSLEVLELGGNRLQHLAKDTFAFLVNGFYLNLKANKISEVHSFAFRSFGGKNDNRHQISLEYNRLQFIDHILRVFQPKKNLYSFYFGGNPIFCDCNLINFMNEARALFGDTHKMICESPSTYVGTRVRDLRIEDCCF